MHLSDKEVGALQVSYTTEANFEPKRAQRSSASQAAAQAAISRQSDKAQKAGRADRADKGKGKATPEDPAQTRLSLQVFMAACC